MLSKDFLTDQKAVYSAEKTLSVGKKLSVNQNKRYTEQFFNHFNWKATILISIPPNVIPELMAAGLSSVADNISSVGAAQENRDLASCESTLGGEQAMLLLGHLL